MLTWSVAGPVALLSLLAITFLLLVRWLTIEAEWVDHTDRVISTAERTQALLVDMETHARGYLLTRSEIFLAPYRRASSEADESFAQLRALVSDNPEQRAAVERLESSYILWHELVSNALASASDDRRIIEGQIAGKEQLDAISSGFARFIRIEETLRARRSNTVQRVTRVVVATTTIVALLFGVITGYFTRRALKSVASEYETALAQSESVNRAKDEFLATLSHELRTPLTAILGWSRLLQIHDTDPENLKVALDAIERSARAQSALIEDILDVSRIITGKLRLNIGNVNMRDAVSQAVDSIQPAASGKEISIEIDAPDPVMLRADPNRLQQIIWNLLSNAVKFSPARSHILVRVNRARENVVLSVIDEGRGIDAAFLPYVFDRFRQADSTSTREQGGLGIGLSVVKLLVELHGGSVRAESGGAGMGSTFTVTMPAHEPPRDGQAKPVAPDDLAARVAGAMR
jgi:signal transduction histidine kinase